MYREWANIGSKYDLLDVNPELRHFELAKHNFDESSDELERKLATQFDRAFEQCNTTTQTATLIQILTTILHRPKIMEELQPRFEDVVQHFKRELEQIKRTFDRGVANIEEGGLRALPVGPGQAPMTGVLKWIHSLRTRITAPAGNFPYLDYEYVPGEIVYFVPIICIIGVYTCSCFKDEFGQYVMSQCEEMLKLLDHFEAQIVQEWATRVEPQIPELLNLHLMLREDKLLVENFDNDVQYNMKFHLVLLLTYCRLQLATALRETRTQLVMEREDVPKIALDLFEQDNDLYVRKSVMFA